MTFGSVPRWGVHSEDTWTWWLSWCTALSLLLHSSYCCQVHRFFVCVDTQSIFPSRKCDRDLSQRNDVSCNQTCVVVWCLTNFTKFCRFIFPRSSLCAFTTIEAWSVPLCVCPTCVRSFQARICFPPKTFCCENHIIMNLSSFMMLTMIIYLRLPKNFISFSNEDYGFEDYVICSDMSIKMEIQRFISVARKKEGSKQESKQAHCLSGIILTIFGNF